MGRPLRFIPDGARRWKNRNGEPIAVVVATVRCVEGRHLLRPCERSRSVILGVLGRAQALYDFELYGYQFGLNRFDLMLGVRSAVEASRIFHFVNTNLSKELGRVELSDWPGRMFEGRTRSIVVLDEEDLITQLEQLLAHCVDNHQVKRCTDWPGVHCAHALTSRRAERGTWVDRSTLWRIRRLASDRRKKATRRAGEADVSTIYTVELSKLPCWSWMSDQDYQKRVKSMCRHIAEDAALAREGTNIRVRGAKALKAEHPHAQGPCFDAAPEPLVHCDDEDERAWFTRCYRAFCRKYREVVQSLVSLADWPKDLNAGIPPSRLPA